MKMSDAEAEVILYLLVTFLHVIFIVPNFYLWSFMLHTTYRTVLVSLVTSVILNVLQLLCWAPDSLVWGYQDSCIFYLAEFCAVALAIPSRVQIPQRTLLHSTCYFLTKSKFSKCHFYWLCTFDRGCKCTTRYGTLGNWPTLNGSDKSPFIVSIQSHGLYGWTQSLMHNILTLKTTSWPFWKWMIRVMHLLIQ